jgi:hypothetical protein
LRRLTTVLRYAPIVFLFLLSSLPLFAQQFDDRKTTTVGNIRLGMTNYGVVGNGFRFYSLNPVIPSCVFPAGSGVENLFNASLWVGGVVQGVPRVTTGSNVETGNSGGNPDSRDYEFVAIPNPVTNTVGVQQRSTLLSSPSYNPSAVSQQDFIAVMTDTAIIRPTTNTPISGHIPLNIRVRSEHYAWSFSFANFFVILTYQITNIGSQPIDSVYLGMFQNSVVRNTNITFPAGTDFYTSGAAGFLDSSFAMYKYDNPVSGRSEPSTQSFYSMKFLGALVNDTLFSPRVRPNFNVNFSSWEFSGAVLPRPLNDIERYSNMARGIPANDTRRQILRTPGNRVELVSAGPFRRLAPGQSTTVVFAITCAQNTSSLQDYLRDSIQAKAQLISNFTLAQQTFNGEDRNGNGILEPGEDRNGNGKIDRYILPTPPPSPATRIASGDKKVTLFWDRITSEEARDNLTGAKDFEGYRIYRTNPGNDIQQGGLRVPAQNGDPAFIQKIAQYDIAANGIGFDNGFGAVRLSQPMMFPNDTTKYVYKYDITNLLNGWQYGFAVTAFDSGDVALGVPSLESSPLFPVLGATPGKLTAENNPDAPIGIYPNPFYTRAAWSPGASARDQKLYFSNLPSRCEITVFTVAGDVIDRFTHDAASYAGGTNRWSQRYGNQGDVNAYSGGETAWDMISKSDQPISSGLYIVAVKDLNTGKVKTGKFVVVR